MQSLHRSVQAPRYDGSWYRRHHTSCLHKAAAFAVGAAVNLAPFLVLFHVRGTFTGRAVLWRHALRDAAVETLGAAGVTGVFMGLYCSLNNLVGSASYATASGSAAVAASCLGLGQPRIMPKLAVLGIGVAVVVWFTTPVLQLLAQERQ